jgi:hypothetical protein
MTAKSGSLVLVIALALVPAITLAQTSTSSTKPAEPIVSPGMSQSASDLMQDKVQCLDLASNQTGVSPEKADKASKSSAAAANDAAKGSSSGISSSSSGATQTAKGQASSASSLSDEKLSAYYKAFGDCMKSRGYTVKPSQ